MENFSDIVKIIKDKIENLKELNKDNSQENIELSTKKEINSEGEVEDWYNDVGVIPTK